MIESHLADLGRELENRRIPYMIIGGQAVLLYGEPRLTRDIDITLGISVEQYSIIESLAKQLHLVLLPDKPEEFAKRTMVLPAQYQPDGIRVDFIFSTTPYERQAISRARSVSIAGSHVHFATPEDLIVHKVFAGRARDMEDIRSILKKNPSLELQYITRWLGEFQNLFPEKEFLKIWNDILKSIQA